MAQNIIIRSEKEEDFPGIRQVNILAFKNREKEADFVEAVRNSEFFIPELSLVALTDDQVIGHILFSGITIETENGEVPTLALAPMAVSPEYQNYGIGSQLVSEGLKMCKNLGFKHVIVLGHPNFYPKFGFIPSKNFEIEPPFPVPAEVFMAIELQPHALSECSGKVKYPETFKIVD